MSGFLIIRGVDLNNNNHFISYSRAFFLHRKIKKSKKYNFVGDFFYTDDLRESIIKFDEYKEWFELNKKLQNKTASFSNFIEKVQHNQTDNILYLIYNEIERLEKRIETLEKENEKLKMELFSCQKKHSKGKK